MKLKYAHITNFKGVKDVRVDFQPAPHTQPVDLHAIIGDNGSGKSTVLQAIALTLSLATRKTRWAASFQWLGVMPERISSLGPTRVEIEVQFTDEEIELNTQMHDEWMRLGSPGWIDHPVTHEIQKPGRFKSVTLIFERGELKAMEGLPGLLQFYGRYYINSILRQAPQFREFLAKLGEVFWFDQYRNLGTAGFSQMAFDTNGSAKREGHEHQVESFLTGVKTLREALVVMWGYQAGPPLGNHSTNYLPALKDKFNLLYPGTNFVGTAGMPSSSSPSVESSYFLLEREGRVFDLSEMSSGEQAFFAIIYDFVRLGIHRSVVLIDELELHLHPPEQQALLAGLQKIGPDCQFLITTHSPFVEGGIPKEHETRLKVGRLCL